MHLGEGKTLNISKWKSEVATLKKDKQNLYNQILEIREEVEQAEKSLDLYRAVTGTGERAYTGKEK